MGDPVVTSETDLLLQMQQLMRIDIHCDLVIFGHWVSQNCLPKITKRKLRGYCYLVIGQNFSKKIYLIKEHRKLRKRKLRGRKLRGHSVF